MARTFDAGPLLNFIRSYWRDFYKDRKKLERFWEGVIRLMDDEYAQIEQINDSGSVISVPSFIYHTYLYRKLEAWKIYGVPHRHFRKDFRATAGQQIFYIGDWPDPKESQVYLHGKETTPESDPYIITYEQDATQPGTNPAGARLIFQDPQALNAPVTVFADKNTVHEEIEITSSGLTSFSFPDVVDHASVKVVLKKVNLTRFLSITANSFSWQTFPSSVQDSRVFRRGEIFEVVDGATVQRITISETGTSVDIPTAVTPGSTEIYRIVDLDITEGKIQVDGKIVSAGDQSFPPSSLVRAADISGSEGRTIETAVSAIEYDREYDPESAAVFLYSGEITGGYKVTSSGITWDRSFMEGVVLVIDANLVQDNDHAHYREVLASQTDRVTVPGTRPFVLDGVNEKDGYPILVYVDGILQHPDTYVFLSATEIQFNLQVPKDSIVDVYYTDLEDPEPHLHVVDRFRVIAPTSAFQNEGKPADDYPRVVSVAGVMVSNTTNRWFSQNGEFLNFSQPLASGSVVQVRGARKSFLYHHEIETDIVRADYLQNGIDERETVTPAGWTVQLVWDDGFLITSGLLESNELIEDAWFVNALIDERTAYKNFGFLVDFNRPTSDEYVRILRAVYAGNYAGSQIGTVEDLVNVLLGSEYLDEAGKVTSITRDQVVVGERSYPLDVVSGPRVTPEKTYRKYTAVSDMARVIDEWDPFDEIALIGQDFSENYSFAKTLDVSRDRILEGDGDNIQYERDIDRIKDPDTDFFLEQVWPGDLISVWTSDNPTVALYGRVISVSRHAIQTTISPQGTPVGYGRWRYGRFAYGTGSLIIPLDRYRIWVRRTDTLDVWRHLDEALPEDIPYLANRLHDLLVTFTFLVDIKWSSVKDGTALRDVTRLVERLKPKEQRGIVLTRAFDGGLHEEVTGQVQDQGLTIDELANFAFVSSSPEIVSIVGEDGQISPNVGSFLGP
jgi:hypothetical protein